MTKLNVVIPIIVIIVIFLIFIIFKFKNDCEKICPVDCAKKCPCPPTPPSACDIPDGGSGPYALNDSWQGMDLHPASNKGWLWFDKPDPTYGVVNYDRHTKLITPGENGEVKISVDSTYPPEKQRGSVRLFTAKKYNEGLFIMKASHMPAGLAVWPAFWLTGYTDDKYVWAATGEIDIIEGVNSTSTTNNKNSFTLHTNELNGSKCLQNGVPNIENIDCATTDQPWTSCGLNGTQTCPTVGCGTTLDNEKSFGFGFNKNKGGVYACELTNDGKVTIWFFEPDNIPSDIQLGIPDPDKWKANNVVKFNPCPGHFKMLNIVINTTLCGAWAGNQFPTGSTPEEKMTNCKNYVWNKSPPDQGGFDYREAYWSIDYVKVFKKIETILTK